jgi:WS/DGAT/MGAT family acyltransferase
MRETMAPVDAAWFRMEDPADPMTVVAVLWFAVVPAWPELTARFEERVVRRYARFRQRVVERRLGRPVWADDPTFALDAHVHHIALPPPHDSGALQRLIGDRAGTPLDLRFAPWSLDLVDGFGAGGAIVVRIHHCVADGLALSQVLLGLADGASPEPVQTERVAFDARGPFHRARATVAALGKLLFSPADARSALKGNLGAVKRVAWSSALPLASIRERGRAERATVNDVIVAAVAGALRRWLLAQGHEPVDVRAFVPVDLRMGDQPDAQLGNRFGLVYLSLPVAEPDPMLRLRATQQRMAAIKGTPEAVVAFGILTAMGLAPAAVERVSLRIFGAKGTLVLTNVRGPTEPMFICGNEVEGLMFWVPQSGRLGVGVSILSYAGQVRVGVYTDAGIIDDPWQVVAAIESELAQPLAGSMARVVEDTR